MSERAAKIFVAAIMTALGVYAAVLSAWHEWWWFFTGNASSAVAWMIVAYRVRRPPLLCEWKENERFRDRRRQEKPR